MLAENKDLRTPLKLAQSMAHNKTVDVLQQHAREEAEVRSLPRACRGEGGEFLHLAAANGHAH